MSNKITAHFGADVSEVEAKMMQATRATKHYERAVKALGGAKVGPQSVTDSLNKANESLNKGIGLLKGGALAAGLGMVIGQMRSWADHAKAMGDAATDAQKSAAKWADELTSFTDTIKGWGASALGVLAQFGRDVGDMFRDPADKAYDKVAESSEEMAKRAEAALREMRDDHAKAAEELPKLREKLAGEKRETQLSQLDAEGRAFSELYETQKKIAELAKQPRNAINEKRRIELLIELEQRQRRFDEIRQKREQEDARAQQDAAQKTADKKAAMEEEVADVVAMIGDQQKKNDEAAIERAKRLAEERQKAAEAGREKNRERFGEQLSEAGFSVDEEGNLRNRRGRKISQEDAARVLETRRREAELASRTGQVRGSRPSSIASTKTPEAGFLEKIEAYLRPESTK